jgi:hypothetical protein
MPFAPDWRWMLAREDSIWYPTMRIFRQPSYGDWAGAIEQIQEALVALQPENRREAETQRQEAVNGRPLKGRRQRAEGKRQGAEGSRLQAVSQLLQKSKLERSVGSS